MLNIFLEVVVVNDQMRLHALSQVLGPEMILPEYSFKLREPLKVSSRSCFDC
ncbi:gsl3580 [Gloeobacter violaceus PCC 7421]|uniref:Gsl3580 protein n=1 Tax=Gloeobacter violaceus (strain ATCC 29082 / PCC 7421) TaxID=251221 RepID=Q7NFE6_GLOVI|nr:gsl3580 [Gloeobacter violaceus PCC 7421]